MQKRKPHYDLNHVKALIQAGNVAFSNATLAGASVLGLDEMAITEIVANLQYADFHVSNMANPHTKIWLDLYRPITGKGQIYLKIKVTDDVFVVSFLPKSAITAAGP